MVRVTAHRRAGYTHDVEIEGGHKLVIDEPKEDGGNNEGPAPTRTVGAALAACTAITVEMYADRKGWDVGKLEVGVEIDYDGATPKSFEVTLRVPGTLSEEQQDKLLVVAGKCPVHRLLSHETEVTISDRVEPT